MLATLLSPLLFATVAGAAGFQFVSSTTITSPGERVTVYDVARDDRGSVLILGQTERRFWISRFNSSLKLEASSDLPLQNATAVARDQEGKIWVLDHREAIQLTPDLTPATKIQTANSYESFSAITVRKDGRVLIGGQVYSSKGRSLAWLGEFSSRGILLSSRTFTIGDIDSHQVASVFSADDGTIWLAGYAFDMAGAGRSSREKIWLARVSGSFEMQASRYLDESSSHMVGRLAYPPIARGIVYDGNSAWLVGWNLNQLFVAQFNRDLDRHRYYSLAAPSQAEAIALTPQGHVLVSGVKDGQFWLSEFIGESMTRRSVLRPAKNINLATSAKDSKLAFGPEGEFVVTGNIPLDPRQVGWLGRFRTRSPPSAPESPATAPESTNWAYKESIPEPALVEKNRKKILDLMEQADRLSSLEPRNAIAEFDKAQTEALAANERKLAADCLIHQAALHIAFDEMQPAKALISKATSLLNGNYDLDLMIQIVKQNIAIDLRLNDDDKASSDARWLNNLYLRKGDKRQAADALTQAVDYSLHKAVRGYHVDVWTLITASDLLGLLTELSSDGSCAQFKAVGYVAIANERYSSAYRYFKAAMSFAERAPDRTCLIGAMAGQSAAAGYLGEYSQALELGQKALAEATKLGDKETMQKALSHLGAAYRGIGNYDAALEYEKRAIAISKETGIQIEDDHVGLAETLMDLGDEFGAFQQYYTADQLFPRKNIGVIGEADFLLRKGQPQMMESLNKLNVAVWRKAHYDLATGNLVSAKNYFGGWSQWGFANGIAGFIIGADVGFGRVAEMEKKYDKAQMHYSSAIDAEEMFRARLSGPDRTLTFAGKRWLIPRTEPYEGMVRIAPKTALGTRGSFHYSEQTKARSFIEGIAAKRRIPPLPPVLHGEHERLETAFRRAGDDYFSVVIDTVGGINDQIPAAMAAYEKLRLTWGVRKKFIDRIRLEAPWYAESKYPKILQIEDIELAPDEVVIEYSVTDTQTKIFVIRNSSITAVFDVPVNRFTLELVTRRFLMSFANAEIGADLSDFLPKLGVDLYATLLKQPLTARDTSGKLLVRPEDKIIIIPDGALRLLPFEALPTRIPKRLEMPSSVYGPVPIGISYVGDQYDIAYQQSATALMQQRKLRRAKQPSDRALLIADPIFGPSDSRAKNVSGQFPVFGEFRTRRTDCAMKTMSRLGVQRVLPDGTTSKIVDNYVFTTWCPPPRRSEPGAIKAAGGSAPIRSMGPAGTRPDAEKSISDTYDSFPRLYETSDLLSEKSLPLFGRETTVLSGAAATEERLRGLPLSDYRYLIFATHGMLNDSVPGVNEPALVLGQKGNKAGFNGFYSASEIGSANLNADLVVLTACDTGIGRPIPGEGVMSLGRAFQIAGARKILSSMWEVSGEASVKLTELFFEHIKSGKEPRQALRLARQELRRQGYEHPYYWAPFVLFTD